MEKVRPSQAKLTSQPSHYDIATGKTEQVGRAAILDNPTKLGFDWGLSGGMEGGTENLGMFRILSNDISCSNLYHVLISYRWLKRIFKKNGPNELNVKIFCFLPHNIMKTHL